MQKEIVGHNPGVGKKPEDTRWLELESVARVELTSEEKSFPIENALSMNPEANELGWRAAGPGPQTIALVFSVPTNIRRIFVHFIEREAERTQEFMLRYSSAKDTGREIVRQQWNFSPTGSSQEIEDYTVQLGGVTRLELVIDPDRGLGQNPATLNALRVA